MALKKYKGLAAAIKDREEGLAQIISFSDSNLLNENSGLRNEYFRSSVKIASQYYSNLDFDKLKIQYKGIFRFLGPNYSPFGKISEMNFKGSKFYHQYYYESYDIMLWALSLGYLLNVNIEEYQKLVDILDYDKVTDKVYEFIIAAKIHGRKKVGDSCEPGNVILKVYEQLRKIITTDNKQEVQNLMKNYVEDDWMLRHAKYNLWPGFIMKEERNIYPAWSFESAAIVKIMSLDDSSFLNAPFYPKKLLTI